MDKIQQLKINLARVFDDNLHTKQWHNYMDYCIIGMIVVSTISIFVSTFNVSPIVEKCIYIINIVTLIFFSIEVTLRIWVADVINPKYKGFIGRIKYCFTFYGLIDIISTYPFYVQFIIPVPYNMLKSLRIIRLFRVFRYMRSFRLLSKALSSKKHEMLVSLQFLAIVTLLLSFILYFAEHAVQPDVYNNGFVSVVWAFAQYIGDPGGFAETPPVTFIGRIIACIIGILGIALFAVPAGLVGAGFTDAMKEEEHGKEVKENIEKLHRAFERKLDRPTGFQIVPQYLSICDIQARMGMKTDEIFDAVEASDNFRLINLATTQPVNEHPQDKLAIEHFLINRSYGYCINRNSKITIVSPSSLADAAIGHFSYYLAKIGGFNFISRELGELRPYRSYYTFSDRSNHEENLEEYMSDLEELTSKEGSWTLTPLAASGANEPTYPTQFHFSAGGRKGDERFEGEDLIVADMEKYKAFYEDLSQKLETDFGFKSDHQRYHNCSTKNLFARKYKNGHGSRNNILLRIAWSVCLWDMRRIDVARLIAEVLNRHFENDVQKEYSPELKIKQSGY